MKSVKDPRHIARIISIMDLFRFFFPESSSESFDIDSLEFGNHSKKMRDSISTGVKEKHQEIDEIIDKYSTSIKAADLNNLILQIIRVAIYEGFISKSAPAKVAIDEAIELTRDFGLENDARKVGGILGKIFDNLATQEEKATTENKLQ